MPAGECKNKLPISDEQIKYFAIKFAEDLYFNSVKSVFDSFSKNTAEHVKAKLENE